MISRFFASTLTVLFFVTNVIQAAHPPVLKSTSSPVVIYIQDIHGLKSAQQQISSTIEKLAASHPGLLIGAEGASGLLETSLFRSARLDLDQEVAELFLNSNLIGGVEYAAMRTPHPVRFVGIEQKELYLANVHAVREALAAQPTMLTWLETQQHNLAQKKNLIYSPAMIKLDRASTAFDRGEMSITEFLEFLRTQVSSLSPAHYPHITHFLSTHALEKSLDIKAAERERDLFLSRKRLRAAKQNRSFPATIENLGKLIEETPEAATRFPHLKTYVDYVSQADQIEAEQLIADLNRWVDQCWRNLKPNAAQQRLLDEVKQTSQAEKLVRLSLTKPEWAAFAASHLHPDLKKFESFYELASARDQAMASNFLAELTREKEGPKVAVLVTGGFHESGITKILNQKGIQVVKVVPHLSEADLNQTENYLSVFTRAKTPLERIFESPRLSLPKSFGMRPLEGVAVAEPLKNQLLPLMEKADTAGYAAQTDIDGNRTSVWKKDRPAPFLSRALFRSQSTRFGVAIQRAATAWSLRSFLRWIARHWFSLVWFSAVVLVWQATDFSTAAVASQMAMFVPLKLKVMGHQTMRTVAFARDGTLLTGTEGAIKTWFELDDGKRVMYNPGPAAQADIGVIDMNNPLAMEYLKGEYGEVNSLLTNGDLVVSVHPDGIVHTWQRSTRKLTHTYRDNHLKTASLSPNGKKLVTGNDRNRLMFRNTDTGNFAFELDIEVSPQSTLAFDPTGNKLAVADPMRGPILIVDIATRKVIDQIYFEKRAWPGGATALAFSPDSRTIAVGSVGGTVTLTDMLTGRQQIAWMESKGLSGTIQSLAFSPDGKILAAGGMDGIVRFWNAEKGQGIGLLPTYKGVNAPGIIYQAAFDQFLALSQIKDAVMMHPDESPTVHLWRDGQVRSLAFSPDGKLLAAASGPFAYIWDVSDLSNRPTTPDQLPLPFRPVLSESSLPLSEVRALKKAGSEMMDITRATLERTLKEGMDTVGKKDGSLVTAADRNIQNAVLSEIQKRFPTHFLLAEEKIKGAAAELNKANEQSDYKWILDPIDGTLELASDTGYYAIPLALFHKGRPVFSMIWSPAFGLIEASQDEPLPRRNGEPFAITDPIGEKLKMVLCGTSFNADRVHRFIRRKSGPAYIRTIPRSSVVTAVDVMLGNFHGYFDLRMSRGPKIWDFAAVAYAFKKSGGEFFVYEKGRLAPVLEMLHEDLELGVFSKGYRVLAASPKTMSFFEPVFGNFFHEPIDSFKPVARAPVVADFETGINALIGTVSFPEPILHGFDKTNHPLDVHGEGPTLRHHLQAMLVVLNNAYKYPEIPLEFRLRLGDESDLRFYQLFILLHDISKTITFPVVTDVDGVKRPRYPGHAGLSAQMIRDNRHWIADLRDDLKPMLIEVVRLHEILLQRAHRDSTMADLNALKQEINPALDRDETLRYLIACGYLDSLITQDDSYLLRTPGLKVLTKLLFESTYIYWSFLTSYYSIAGLAVASLFWPSSASYIYVGWIALAVAPLIPFQSKLLETGFNWAATARSLRLPALWRPANPLESTSNSPRFYDAIQKPRLVSPRRKIDSQA